MQTEWQTMYTLIWVYTLCPGLSVQKLRIIVEICLWMDTLNNGTQWKFVNWLFFLVPVVGVWSLCRLLEDKNLLLSGFVVLRKMNLFPAFWIFEMGSSFETVKLVWFSGRFCKDFLMLVKRHWLKFAETFHVPVIVPLWMNAHNIVSYLSVLSVCLLIDFARLLVEIEIKFRYKYVHSAV